MHTQVVFTNEELEMNAMSLQEAGNFLHQHYHSPMMRPERESMRKRASKMHELARRIRFASQTDPVDTSDDAPVAMQATEPEYYKQAEANAAMGSNRA